LEVTRRIAVSSSSQIRQRWAWTALEGLRAGSSGEVLLIAPARAAADDFVRTHTAAGSLGIHCFTLPQLAALLAAEALAERRLAPVSRLGVEALAVRSIHSVQKRRPLEYFKPVADLPGFARALANTLHELRLAEVTPGALRATGVPGADLAELLTQYEAELAAASLADLAMLYRVAAEHAAHGLTRLPYVLLDVSAESAAEQRFLAAAASLAPAAAATVPAGDEEALAAILAVLGRTALPEDLDDSPPRNSLERVCRYVFVSETGAPRESDATLDFFSAAGEGLECVEIARRIRAMADSERLPFDRMAILLRNPDRYLPLVEDALRRAGIPAYFTRGSLRPDPAGRAFLALLECAAEGLSASRFAEYLSLGQVPRPDVAKEPAPWAASEDEGQRTAPPALEEEARPAAAPETDESPVIDGTLRTPVGWERLLVEASVIGGRDRWRRRLSGLEAEYRLQLSDLGDEDESRRDYLSAQIERLGNLQRYALPIIDALDALPAEASWGDWLDALAGIAGLALRNPQSVAGVLAELRPMSEVGPVTLDEVRAVLGERLRFLRSEPPPRRFGRVFVASINEAAGRCFDVVFLPGLAEGMFPKRNSEDPLLLDEARKALGTGMRVQAGRFAEERQLLRAAAGAAASRLAVSYPRTDAMLGRTRVPSFYALEVLRAAEGQLPELRELEKRAGRDVTTRLGWPAPKEPRDAIDDTEHDLALLEPLLHQPSTAVRGKGKYLLEANAHLARSLRTRGRRWRNFWSEADGIVDPDAATRDVLAKYRFGARVYSASALQLFAACPYRFLLASMHRLRPREEAEPLEQLDPLTRGALFHSAQFHFFQTLHLERLLPVSDENLSRVLDAADRVMDWVAGEYEEKLAPAIPRVWESEIEGVRTDLRAWIRSLPPIHRLWRPLHWELAFGLPAGGDRDTESSAEPVDIDGAGCLRGSIDLVEIDAAGSLRITDHKTGKAPSPQPAYVGGGEVLQPLLYAQAAEQLLGKPARASQLFFCTQRGGYTPVEIAVTDRSRAFLRMVLQNIDNAIEGGFLPAAPRKEACEYCDYRMVCGPYEEQRVKRKLPDRLEPLQQIRNAP
jgi:ATP-dependent helicase/nuclease subunit B